MPARLQCFIHRLEKQTLLRIDGIGLVGANEEELRIESSQILLEKIRMSDIASAMVFAVWMVEASCIEPVWRDLLSNIARLLEQLPQCCRRVNPSWKATTSPDDGDGLCALTRHRFEKCEYRIGSKVHFKQE